MPANLLKDTVFLDQRLCQAIFAADKLIAEPALDAQAAPVDTDIITGGNDDHPVIHNIELKLAAAPAVGAGCSDTVNQPGPAFVPAEIFSQGARRADLQAFAAADIDIGIDGQIVSILSVGDVNNADAGSPDMLVAQGMLTLHRWSVSGGLTAVTAFSSLVLLLVLVRRRCGRTAKRQGS